MAARATATLADPNTLLLADLVVAECVYVLESFYEVERARFAELMRAAIALPSIEALDPDLLLRALEIYEVDTVDFAEAYLVALAETTGVGHIASVDRSIDRVRSVERREPWAPAGGSQISRMGGDGSRSSAEDRGVRSTRLKRRRLDEPRDHRHPGPRCRPDGCA